MKWMNGCIIAFSMYSKIPMPKAEWDKENMKYTMCFFPWVGAVIGLLFYGWSRCAERISAGTPLYGVVLTLIPLLITGGIHMDGLLDTADALSSWQSKERRLEILKDPHAGAFAIITCCMYVLAYFGFACELNPQGIVLLAAGFFLSRCLSGYAVTAFPCARDSGLAAAFANGADKKRAGFVLLLEALGISCFMVWYSWKSGGTALIAALLVFFWYYRMSVKKFGGITGDLAGWFLQMCELMMLMGVVLMEKIL